MYKSKNEDNKFITNTSILGHCYDWPGNVVYVEPCKALNDTWTNHHHRFARRIPRTSVKSTASIHNAL